MDVATIDQAYQQLQAQSQETVQELQQLAGKLQTAAQAGDQNAREWLIDLKSVALAIRAEQQQVQFLLQSLHGAVANEAQFQQPMPQQMPQPMPQQVPMQQAPMPQQSAWGAGGQAPQQSGFLGNLLQSGFARAIETGAGFGIGDELINKIF